MPGCTQPPGACCLDQLFREKSSAAEKFLRSIEFSGLIGTNISGLVDIWFAGGNLHPKTWTDSNVPLLTFAMATLNNWTLHAYFNGMKPVCWAQSRWSSLLNIFSSSTWLFLCWSNSIFPQVPEYFSVGRSFTWLAAKLELSWPKVITQGGGSRPTSMLLHSYSCQFRFWISRTCNFRFRFS